MFGKSIMAFTISLLVLILSISIFDAVVPAPIDVASRVLPNQLLVRPDQQYRLVVEKIASGMALPEAITTDSHNNIYVGAQDGKVWNMTKPSVAHANTGGYPIGLFYDDASDSIYVANYPLGLQRIDSQGRVTSLLTEVDNKKLGFADDLVVAKNGKIYITEASTKFNPLTMPEQAPMVTWDFLEARGNGRVVVYDLHTGYASVLLDNLSFPSGVSLSQDETTLYVVEVGLNRVIQLDLAQPKPSMTGVDPNILVEGIPDDTSQLIQELTGADPKILLEGLPGIPDDIFVDSDNRIWVSLISPRDPLADKLLMPNPWLRRLMSRLPYSFLNNLGVSEEGGSVLLLSESGQLLCQYLVEPSAVIANIQIQNREILLAILSGDSPLQSQLPKSSCNQNLISNSDVPDNQP